MRATGLTRKESNTRYGVSLSPTFLPLLPVRFLAGAVHCASPLPPVASSACSRLTRWRYFGVLRARVIACRTTRAYVTDTSRCRARLTRTLRIQADYQAARVRPFDAPARDARGG